MLQQGTKTRRDKLSLLEAHLLLTIKLSKERTMWIRDTVNSSELDASLFLCTLELRRSAVLLCVTTILDSHHEQVGRPT